MTPPFEPFVQHSLVRMSGRPPSRETALLTLIFHLPRGYGNCVEINSTFYRSHRPSTYDRWAQSVPAQTLRLRGSPTGEVNLWLKTIGVGRVAADPAVIPEAAAPGGSEALTYFRLHGSPNTHYSSYAVDSIEKIALKSAAADHRCRDGGRGRGSAVARNTYECLIMPAYRTALRCCGRSRTIRFSGTYRGRHLKRL